jgi:NADH-quinone oxidoreductase subunit J
MSLFDIAFYIIAVLTIASAIVVVSAKNIIYSAFALLFTFFGVAGLYVLLNADFIAVTQVFDLCWRHSRFDHIRYNAYN